MKKLNLSNRIVRDIPSEWNELSFAQLMALSALTMQQMPLAEVKARLFIILSGLQQLPKPSLMFDGDTWHWFALGKVQVLIAATQLTWAAGQLLGFFKPDGEGNYYLHSTLTRNIFPQLCAGKLKLIGPADGLTNITYKEFIHAENLHYQYLTTKNEDDLNSLIAVLFRPANKELNVQSPTYKGDLRQPFNDYQIDYYATFTAQLKPEIKQAILYYYQGCKGLIAALFPNVFKPATTSSSDNSTNIAISMMCIVDELTNHQPSETERSLNELAYMVLSSFNNLLTKHQSKDELWFYSIHAANSH